MFCHNVGAWMVINDKSNFDVELSYDMFCDTCLCNKLYIPAVEEKINSVDWNLIAAMIYACKEADEYEKKLKRSAKKINNSKKED